MNFNRTECMAEHALKYGFLSYPAKYVRGWLYNFYLYGDNSVLLMRDGTDMPFCVLCDIDFLSC